MTILSAIILGVVQGLTEFLPVSSSGHLAVFQHFLGTFEGNLTFDIAVHLGTVLSVLTVYYKSIIKVFKGLIGGLISRDMNASVQLVICIFIGSLPAGAVGMFFKAHFEQMFGNLWIVCGGFLFTSLLLYFSRNKGSGNMGNNFLEFDNSIGIHWRQALVVGLAQAFAIIPGVSRAGSTIAMGLITGLDRRSSALLSFMLAIPAILGASLMQVSHVQSFGAEELKILLTGIFVSYAVGLIGLKVVLLFVKEGRMHYFSYYLWALVVCLGIYQLKG